MINGSCPSYFPMMEYTANGLFWKKFLAFCLYFWLGYSTERLQRLLNSSCFLHSFTYLLLPLFIVLFFFSPFFVLKQHDTLHIRCLSPTYVAGHKCHRIFYFWVSQATPHGLCTVPGMVYHFPADIDIRPECSITIYPRYDTTAKQIDSEVDESGIHMLPTGSSSSYFHFV